MTYATTIASLTARILAFESELAAATVEARRDGARVAALTADYRVAVEGYHAALAAYRAACAGFVIPEPLPIAEE